MIDVVKTMNKKISDLQYALKSLSNMDGDIKTTLENYGNPPDRTLPANFGSLARIIVGQQVSRSAATSIWKRLLDIDIEDSKIISEVKPEDMMTAGLSRRKSEYIIGIANEIVSGNLDLKSLNTLHGEEVKERLISLRGVGAWTADNYRLFVLGDMDAWPANDIALQGGMKIIKSLDDRPNREDMESLGENWRPYRGAGALLLWHVYGVVVKKADVSNI
ncbi:DNA-3-methyladenine glycosylase 2 family protein [SAR202 cluster bacterium AD-804-J14_MRT_500m]|nr:DNA-3-methyladenine glycosylase 2 family protein [SAR202 cluster bacterium AD-804-J14_MRT_500m]